MDKRKKFMVFEMNKFLIYMFFSLVAFCSHGQTIKSNFSSCLESKVVQHLEEFKIAADTELRKHYNLDLAKTYEKFVQDVAQMSPPKSVLRSNLFSIQITDLRASPLFEQVWIKKSLIESDDLVEIPPVEGEEEIIQPDFHVINPDGPFNKCLISKIQKDDLKEILKVISSGIDLSPSMVAAALKTSLESIDYENLNTQLMIAIHFYYGLGLLLTD